MKKYICSIGKCGYTSGFWKVIFHVIFGHLKKE